jgi:hypothetical protein
LPCPCLCFIFLFYVNDISSTGPGGAPGECLCIPFASTLTLAMMFTSNLIWCPSGHRSVVPRDTVGFLPSPRASERERLLPSPTIIPSPLPPLPEGIERHTKQVELRALRSTLRRGEVGSRAERRGLGKGRQHWKRRTAASPASAASDRRLGRLGPAIPFPSTRRVSTPCRSRASAFIEDKVWFIWMLRLSPQSP